MIGQILSHIPLWVVALLVYGIVMGIRAMFARNISLVTASLLPLLFLFLSLTSLISAMRSVPVSAVVWMVGATLGIVAGLTVLAAKVLDRDAGAGRMRIAGSPATLMVFVLIFATKFCYNFQLASDPSAASNVGFVATTLALSGIGTGIAVGRVTKLLVTYFGHSSFSSAE
ncbi:MAG TPA: DUF6622 family protein [Spirochaetia bacterium]|nr:DUF6622 family protein [Spirochaetia bacterium]